MKIEDAATVKRYYEALLARDPAYVGVFYAAVRTTSVFCLSICRARKPKPENVDFYDRLKDAMDFGFRPCKICRPTENAHDAPAGIRQLMDQLRATPGERIRDARLRELGMGPEAVRRWFQRHYGMSFQAFQRSLRINAALEALQAGRSATQAWAASGYESMSGFGYTMKKTLGAPPAGGGAAIVMHRFTTPLGPMFACATPDGLCLLEFVDRRMLETELRDLQQRLKMPVIAGTNRHVQDAEAQVAEYFAGTRTRFELALDLPGTPFQRLAWQALQDIPFGATSSYREQARRIGRESAVRAVASANGHNRVAIVVPCHRVIGSDGSLTGYGGGLERKRWLLEHEAAVAAPR